MSILGEVVKDGSARLATDDEAMGVSAHAYVIAHMILTTPAPLSVLAAALTIIAEHGVQGYSPNGAIDLIARVAHANIECKDAMMNAGKA